MAASYHRPCPHLHGTWRNVQKENGLGLSPPAVGGYKSVGQGKAVSKPVPVPYRPSKKVKAGIWWRSGAYVHPKCMALDKVIL